MSYRCVQAPLPENTKATTDWGIAFGVNGLPVELLLSTMELLQLRHPCWRCPRQSIYALVCCFKRYYEQHGVFDVNPVICLALYIQHQLFNLENSCCCICAGQTNVLSHDSCSFCNSYNVESCCCVYLQLEKCALSGYCALKCALS